MRKSKANVKILEEFKKYSVRVFRELEKNRVRLPLIVKEVLGRSKG